MDGDELDQHLSRVSTMWTMVLEAHGGEADSATAALAGLAQRYSGVVYRYLLGAVRDPDAAAELSQEFALRILRGAFRRADPSRGRFRDYLKTALIHLVDDYHTAQRARPRRLLHDVPAGPTSGVPEAEPDFVATWRSELLDRTWKSLAAALAERTTRVAAVPGGEPGRALAADGRRTGQLGWAHRCEPIRFARPCSARTPSLPNYWSTRSRPRWECHPATNWP